MKIQVNGDIKDFDAPLTLAGLIELLGDLVAVHRRLRPRQDGQKDQRDDAGAELLLELPQMRLDFDLAHGGGYLAISLGEL